jgi:hypothetical protein
MQLIDAASLPESRVGAITALIDAFGCCLWSLDAAGGARYSVPGRAYGHYEQPRVELVSGGMPAFNAGMAVFLCAGACAARR